MSIPIFIVGPSRSGTELTRSILNNCPSVHISKETHYFDDLRPRLKRPDSECDAQDAGLVTAYFEALQHHAYGLHRYPAASPVHVAITHQHGVRARSADEMFEEHCRAKMPDWLPFWGEKTPRHVFRIDDIRRAYPSARIIFCHRDPRGVVASYRDWKNRWFEGKILDEDMKGRLKAEEDRVRKSYSLLIQCLMWNSAVKSAVAARTRHGENAIYFLKFEDLLSDPSGTIRPLCAWLDLPYSPNMLDIMQVNSSYTDAGTVHGVSDEPSRRWTRTLSEKEIGLIELVTGRTMAALNYQGGTAQKSYIYIMSELCLLPINVVKAFLANRHRISNISDYLISRARGRSV